MPTNDSADDVVVEAALVAVAQAQADSVIADLTTESAQLERQLRHARTVGVAVGMIKGTYGVPDGAASTVLRQLAVDANVAEEIMAERLIAKHSDDVGGDVDPARAS